MKCLFVFLLGIHHLLNALLFFSQLSDLLLTLFIFFCCFCLAAANNLSICMRECVVYSNQTTNKSIGVLKICGLTHRFLNYGNVIRLPRGSHLSLMKLKKRKKEKNTNATMRANSGQRKKILSYLLSLNGILF